MDISKELLEAIYLCVHTKTHNGSNRLTMSASHSNDGGCPLNALATKFKHPYVEDFTKVTHRRR